MVWVPWGDEKFVVVHDGVRPVILPEMIEDCLHGAFEYGAVLWVLLQERQSNR
jgi:2-C-methyl-D-erythritol 4-phosphate cytidylyltransferase